MMTGSPRRTALLRGASYRAWRSLARGGLLICSLAAGLAICEATLRIAYPRYQHLAAPPVPPQERLAARQIRSAYATMFPRPDSGDIHALIYNMLGNRQHREFSERDLREGVNVAFFGDSFTENRYVAVQYSFTEVLDYLLNAQSPRQSPQINVLNFGVDGSGPGQQYARYSAFPHKARLQHVVYVHFWNDFEDLRRHALYGQGYQELIAHVRGRYGWKRWLSSLHVTYLALDAWRRLFSPASAERLDAATAAAFREIVLTWRADVEANGGEFYVVLLPGSRAQFLQLDWPAALEVLDLDGCFDDALPDAQPWRFRTDIHWNEAGNMVIAHSLYRFLEAKLALPHAPDEALAGARHVYYHAFAQDERWLGHRWLPSPPWAVTRRFSDEQAAAIRAKYSVARLSPRQRIMDHVGANVPAVRVGGWEVYALVNSEREEVVFVKADCDEEHPAGRLFLRVLAFGDEHTAGARDTLMEARLGVLGEAITWREGRACMVLRPLHNWANKKRRIALEGASAVQVGAYRAVAHSGNEGGADGGREPELWRETIAFESVTATAARTAPYRAKYNALATRTPDARSVWNVHVLDTEVVYLKDPCRAPDLDGLFHLRPIPATFTDSDIARLVRFRELHGAAGVDSAAMFDGKCIMTLALPQWRIATISTGQRGVGSWRATVHLDVDRFERAYQAATAGPPVARAAFDIYHVEGNLIYIREPCTAADTRARFFLEVFQEANGERNNPDTMPSNADPKTASNLNFAFAMRGIRAEGRCVAIIPLPDYPVTRISTGQFADDKRLWSAETQLPRP